MRLYPLNAPQQVIDHPDWGRFDAHPDHGGFDLPDELSDELHSFHHRGRRIWETEDERSERLHKADLDRRRDPASLYDAVDGFSELIRRLTAAGSSAAPLDPAAEAAMLRKRLAELGAAEDSDGDDGEQPAAKPAPRRRSGKAAAADPSADGT